ARVKPQAQLFLPQQRCRQIARMLKHELMADGDDRGTAAARKGKKRGHRLEEIEDHLRLRLADDVVQLPKNADVFRNVENNACERGCVVDRTVVVIFELQRGQLS